MRRFSLLLGLALGLRAADAPPAAPDPAVMLPPMLVEETTTSATWLYVNTGETEVLSRCSYGITRDLVEAWQEQLQMMRALVPAELLPRRDAPSVLILYAQGMEQTVSAEIKKDLQAREAMPGGTVNIAPGMRIDDRDMHATISYVDESRFDGSTLKITPGHVRYLLQARVPELPGWLLGGLERMLRVTDLRDKPITLNPMIWQNSTESEALMWDAAHPRAVLPAIELFAGDTWQALENQNPRRAEARVATQELFARWAIVSGGATRAAFWKFAARAAEGPVTEEMFEKLFGFDYAELRDRLSDYLPKAVAETKWVDPGDLPRLPSFEVQPATPNQIARVRGEWERLAISYVRRRLPRARDPYIDQTRRTLHRAYDAGDRDPRLLATMGLTEVEAGNSAAAQSYLDQAVTGQVVRPRAYYELARLRFLDLQRNAGEAKSFSAVELAPVFTPLQRGLAQSPPLSESFALYADAWAHCESEPEPTEWAVLEKGPRLFGRRPDVGLPTARALARHGKKAEAVAVLEACVGYALDKNTRAEITRLRAELAGQGK